MTSDVFQTGGSELRRGKRKEEEEEEEREVGEPLFFSFLSLLSPYFTGQDEFLFAVNLHPPGG